MAEDVLEGEFPIAKAAVGYRRRVQGTRVSYIPAGFHELVATCN